MKSTADQNFVVMFPSKHKIQLNLFVLLHIPNILIPITLPPLLPNCMPWQ